MAHPVDVPSLLAAARAGSARALGRLLTVVENGGHDLPGVGPSAAGRAHIVGLTGAPGVGKSTTTSALVGALRKRRQRVAVLAVDPTSPFTGGALLGDRIRMSEHATDPDVFIRSMAARGHLGGLSAVTPQAVRILDAVGFDVILLETVGVGQSEVEIASCADTTVVLLAPGMGDGIQAAKAGLLEVGDVFAVNKADRPGADETAREVRAMLRLGERHTDAWRAPVLKITAADGSGVEALLEAIVAHHAAASLDGTLASRRVARARVEIEGLAVARVRAAWAPELDRYAAAVASGDLSPADASVSLGLGRCVKDLSRSQR